MKTFALTLFHSQLLFYLVFIYHLFIIFVQSWNLCKVNKFCFQAVFVKRQHGLPWPHGLTKNITLNKQKIKNTNGKKRPGRVSKLMYSFNFNRKITLEHSFWNINESKHFLLIYITIVNYITNYLIIIIEKNKLYIYIYTKNPYQQKTQNKNIDYNIASVTRFVTEVLVT